MTPLESLTVAAVLVASGVAVLAGYCRLVGCWFDAIQREIDRDGSDKGEFRARMR